MRDINAERLYLIHLDDKRIDESRMEYYEPASEVSMNDRIIFKKNTILRTCAVCIDHIKVGNTCKEFFYCKHAFHSDCVNRWLCKHTSCPLCRHNIKTFQVV